MRFLILLVFLLLIYWYFFKKKQILFNKKRKGIVSELVFDKNCQTYIKKEEAIKLEIENEIHYFCSKECLNEYLKNHSKLQS